MKNPIRFLGRTYTYDETPEDLNRESRTGEVLQAMVDAALPASRENFNRLQAAKAAQAKQHREEARAIAALIGRDAEND
jgi:hypothetical protein